MKKEELLKLVEEGNSSYEISKILNKGQTTIRYWLRKYELKTKWKAFQKKERFGTQQVCKKHGLTEYSIGNKSRCRKCVVESVQKKRKKLKTDSINYKGGKCSICNYDKCVNALEFHHINPLEKDFDISYKGYTRSWDKVKKELDKCILICANCHRELHSIKDS